MSDCYESMSRTTIRDRPLRQPLIRHSRHPFVNPAPHPSFRRRACPVPRYGAGIQEGWGGVRLPDGGKNQPIAPLSSSYEAFARPWRFRRSKACPVPRYGAGIQGVGRGDCSAGACPQPRTRGLLSRTLGPLYLPANLEHRCPGNNSICVNDSLTCGVKSLLHT